jgi:hypothetical protein
VAAAIDALFVSAIDSASCSVSERDGGPACARALVAQGASTLAIITTIDSVT